MSLTAGVVAFLVPYFVAEVLLASATTSGTALLFFVGAVAVGSPVGGWLADRSGPLRAAAVGGVVTVLALALLLTLGPDAGPRGTPVPDR